MAENPIKHPECFVSTLIPAQSVNCSAAGFIVQSTFPSIIVGKFDKIYLYSSDEYNTPFKIIPLFGEVKIIKVFRPENQIEKKDFIFVVTAQYNVMILECIQEGDDINVITRAHGHIYEHNGIKTNFMVVINHDSTLACLFLHKNVFKFIKLNQEGELNVHSIRIDISTEICDIDFLNPSTIAILLEGGSIKILAIKNLSNHNRSLLEVNSIHNDFVETKDIFIIGIPKPVSEFIVIRQDSILYYDQNCIPKHIFQFINQQSDLVVCYTSINSMGTRYLLGTADGHLLLLRLYYEKQKTFEIKNIKVDSLGEISYPNSLTYLGKNRVYVGSQLGDSQLIYFSYEMDGTDSLEFKVLNTYHNIGPIHDICTLDNESTCQNHIITCSGAFKSGSLREIHMVKSLNIMTSFDLKGITGVWTLYSHMSNGLDDKVIVSFNGKTIIMSYNNGEFEEIQFEGFQTDSETLYCENISENKVIQITQTSLRLICLESKELISDWISLNSITLATCVDQKAICTIANNLYYFKIGSDKIIQRGLKKFKHDISCIDIHPFKNVSGEDEYFVAVGLWSETIITIVILKLPLIDEFIIETFNNEYFIRSISFATFENVNYLLCSFGDGTIFQFNFNTENDLHNKHEITLCTLPPVIQKVELLLSTMFFIYSDTSYVIHSSNKELIFSAIDLNDITHICSFNNESHLNSLLIATSTSLNIVSSDLKNMYLIRTIPLKESPMKIAFQQQSNSFGVITVRKDILNGTDLIPTISASSQAKYTTRPKEDFYLKNKLKMNTPEECNIYNFIILDKNTYSVLHAYQLYTHEHVNSIISTKLGNDPTMYYILATCMDIDRELPYHGRILVFHYDDLRSKLKLVKEMHVERCKGVVEFNGMLAVLFGQTVKFLKWTKKKEFVYERKYYHTDNINNHIKAYKNTIVCNSLEEMSCTLFQIKNDLKNVQQATLDSGVRGYTAMEIINENALIIGADCVNNLVVFGQYYDRMNYKLKEIGRFHLGDTVNVFKHGLLKYTNDVNIMATYTSISINKGILFGTQQGSIGIITQLNSKMSDQLIDHQNGLIDLEGVGCIKYQDWRKHMFQGSEESMLSTTLIDGDLIQNYLNSRTTPDLHECLKYHISFDKMKKNKTIKTSKKSKKSKKEKRR